jgi:fibro-slime domain-containing protein
VSSRGDSGVVSSTVPSVLKSPAHWPVGRIALLLLVSSSLACARSGSEAEMGQPGNSPGANDPAGAEAGSSSAVGGGVAGSPEEGGLLIIAEGDASVPVSGGDGAAPVLTVMVRDFKFWDPNDPMTNPDFQNVVADDHGSPSAGPSVVGTIVQEALGADSKPVYKGGSNGVTVTTHGKTAFDQWYHDVPGINIRFEIPLPLSLISAAQGTYGYDSQVSGVPLSASDPTKMWFPIDNQGFGNQWANHNYSFTTELHTLFTYHGGETFSFSGDDDVFVFINGKLVIDLGGVHAREVAMVDLDSLALTKGQQYPLDLFNAERHNPGSNLSFTTTLTLRPNPLPL